MNTRTFKDALALVAPFVSTDPDRPDKHTPAARGGHVVATDGHTLAAARFDGAVPDTTVNDPERASRWLKACPDRLACVGECGVPERLAHYPVSWDVLVTLSPSGVPNVAAHIPARTHKRSGKALRPRVQMVDPQPIDSLESVRPRKAIGVDGHYLARALRLVTLGVGVGGVYVHADGPLDPLVFAPVQCATVADLLACDRFAIVMPMRL